MVINITIVTLIGYNDYHNDIDNHNTYGNNITIIGIYGDYIHRLYPNGILYGIVIWSYCNILWIW